MQQALKYTPGTYFFYPRYRGTIGMGRGSSHGEEGGGKGLPIATLESPSIFISYQWDKKPEIKRLYSRLTDLGYHCWLDFKQMGGGDVLFSEIAKGVRDAKVVISCVTSNYALSPNCQKEVSLSHDLGKPIIPLLLEKIWPLEGPMGMIFTGVLYIDCSKESTQARFEDEKFDELIEKIKQHVQRNVDSVGSD
eukprot:XP_011673485.1 PREDICTED: uncharacterized protein LOC105442751 [Strongylocentrotus purpuratus]